MKLLGIITLLIGISIFLIDMYLLFVSIGFRKKNCCKCKGYFIDVESDSKEPVEEIH